MSQELHEQAGQHVQLSADAPGIRTSVVWVVSLMVGLPSPWIAGR